MFDILKEIDELSAKDRTSIAEYSSEGYLKMIPGDIHNDYCFLQMYGNGVYSTVWKAYNVKTFEICAIKILKSHYMYDIVFGREIDFMTTIKKNDPNKEFYCISIINSFDIDCHRCIVLEPVNRNLLTYLYEHEKFSLNFVKKIAKQLIIGLNFLHETCKIIHTDLKPENIGIDANEKITILDFGTARNVKTHIGIVQTSHYRAIEVFQENPWNEKIDIWSLGCILFELRVGNLMFAYSGDDDTRNALHVAEIKKLFDNESAKMENFLKKTGYVEKSFAEFILPMFEYDINKRPSAKMLLDDKWFI